MPIETAATIKAELSFFLRANVANRTFLPLFVIVFLLVIVIVIVFVFVIFNVFVLVRAQFFLRANAAKRTFLPLSTAVHWHQAFLPEVWSNIIGKKTIQGLK